MRDMENRCPIGNRKIDGLKEVENETWGQTKQILKSMISENLEIEDVNTERAHQVGNTNNTLPRTAITKPSSIKVLCSFCCQKVQRTKNISEDLSKETLDIRKEKWKSVKSFGSQGKYAV